MLLTKLIWYLYANERILKIMQYPIILYEHALIFPKLYFHKKCYDILMQLWYLQLIRSDLETQFFKKCHKVIIIGLNRTNIIKPYTPNFIYQQSTCIN